MEPQIDKRSKEYKAWKEQQKAAEDLAVIDAVAEIQVPEVIIPQIEPISIEPKSKIMSEVLEKPKPKVYAPLPKGTVAIKPYVTEATNMGAEKYGEVLFPETAQRDIVFCDVRDNIKIYKTGLNEFAFEVQSIADPEEKEARVRYIRETVSYLENVLNSNFKVKKETCMEGYGTATDKFWDNVTMFKSVCVDTYNVKGDRVETFWDKLEIDLDNEGLHLEMKDPHDLIKYHVINAGGFGMIAPSLERAMEKGSFKFYLHKSHDVAIIKAEPKVEKGKAFGYLDKLKDGDPNKLFYITKLMVQQGAMYYRIGGDTATPVLQLYSDVFDILEGKDIARTAAEACHQLLKYADMKIDELQVRAVVKDAMELRLIDIRTGGQMVYLKSNSSLGRSVEDVVTNLQSPINQEVWDSLLDTIKGIWRN